MSIFESDEEMLDGEVIEDLSSKLEVLLEETFEANSESDPRLEMITVLLSFAAHIADDIELNQEGFTQLCAQFYQETVELKQEDQVEEPELFMAPVAKYHKPN